MLSIEEKTYIDELSRSYKKAAGELLYSWTSTQHRKKFFESLNQYYENLQMMRERLDSPRFAVSLEPALHPWATETYDFMSKTHDHFIQEARENFITLIKEIKKDFKTSLNQFEYALDHEIYYTYAYQNQAQFETKYNEDFSKEKNNFLKIMNSSYFKTLLDDLHCKEEEFDSHIAEIRNIIDNIILVQTHAKKQIQRLKLLPKEVMIILCFIKRPHCLEDQNNYLDLDYIIKKNLLKYLPHIFAALEKEKDAAGNPLCTQQQLQQAQTSLYKAIQASSLSLKAYHAGRIMTAILLAILLTPVSLFLTVPWVQKRKKETFIEKRVLSKNDYDKLKQYRSAKESNTDSLFNRQHELRKSVKIKSGKVKILMRNEQAARFDAWLKLRNDNRTNNPLPKEWNIFFRSSKSREEKAIKKNAHTAPCLKF